jgi:Clp amino terminal domain, pathogenicity island component
VPNGYVQPSWGVGVAVEMGDSHLGVEHAFLAMIRNRETVPARALAGLADLDALDAGVVEAANAPVGPHEDAVFLPEGQQLDSPLISVLNNQALFLAVLGRLVGHFRILPRLTRRPGGPSERCQP